MDYEYYLQGELSAKFDIGSIKNIVNNSKINIEHIAPQTILPGVKSMENINLLGNLVLSQDNSSLGNRTFSSKKAIYLYFNLYKRWVKLMFSIRISRFFLLKYYDIQKN